MQGLDHGAGGSFIGVRCGARREPECGNYPDDHSALHASDLHIFPAPGNVGDAVQFMELANLARLKTNYHRILIVFVHT